MKKRGGMHYKKAMSRHRRDSPVGSSTEKTSMKSPLAETTRFPRYNSKDPDPHES